jgi:hypothetical protein
MQSRDRTDTANSVRVHYIPQGIGEISDHLSMMMLSAPRFEDKTGLLPGRSIDTVFTELNEALRAIRSEIGEDNYLTLLALSAKMRAHFEADPEDNSDDGIKGRDCIIEMKNILRSARRPKRRS